MHIVHFDENMLIGDAADLDAFMEMYGVEAISKEYLQLLGKRKFEFHEANGENMKIVIIHGQSHKGSTYHIAHMLAEKISSDIKEFFFQKILENFV